MLKHKSQRQSKRPAAITATLLTAVIAVANLVSSSATANEQTTGKELFVFTEPAARKSAELQKNEKTTPGTVRQQQIGLRISAEQLQQTKRLSLPLFDGQILEVVREIEGGEDIASLSLSDSAWRGKVQGDPDSSVLLTMSSGLLGGSISTMAGEYAITSRRGQHVLSEIDHSLFRGCLMGPDSRKAAPASAQEQAEAGRERISELVRENATPEIIYNAATTIPAAIPDSEVVYVDVLVYYTNALRWDLDKGDLAAPNTWKSIKDAINLTNQAFINSPVNMRVRLHWALEIPSADYLDYNGKGVDAAYNWLNNRTGPGWEKSQKIRDARERAQADLVLMMVFNPSGGGGIANQNHKDTNLDSEKAYSVMAHNEIINQVFAHELAHNMGAHHNPENAPAGGDGTHDYARGHWVDTPNLKFATVMSNRVPNGTRRIPYFSYAYTTYRGEPTGIWNQRDNTFALKLARERVANFRMGRVACGMLRSDQILWRGQQLWSCNRSAYLDFQSDDGNVVLKRGSDNRALWSTLTHGTGADRMIMQKDGNLVVYAGGTWKWHWQTGGWHGAQLYLQHDKNLVLYGWDLNPIKATGTHIY